MISVNDLLAFLKKHDCECIPYEGTANPSVKVVRTFPGHNIPPKKAWVTIYPNGLVSLTSISAICGLLEFDYEWVIEQLSK